MQHKINQLFAKAIYYYFLTMLQIKF